jgi:hypothetical protein
MSAQTSPSSASMEFDALVVGAEKFDPRTPSQNIDLPEAERSFAFTLDNDLIKLVTIEPGNGRLSVHVRYATDTVMQDDRYEVTLSSRPQIVADAMGIVVTWQAPLLPWFGWPMLRRSRRF